MEVKRMVHSCRWLLFLWLVFPFHLRAQPQTDGVPLQAYAIKGGEMYIALSKNLPKASIDSFIRKYSLEDLALDQFLKTNSFDSLRKWGWTLEVNTDELFVISKPLVSSKDMGDVGKKIVYTEKQVGSVAERFPVVSENIIYGYNHFKNKFPFAVNQSVVTFFLRDNLQAKSVMLAGSFNDWNPEVLAMSKTDSGWIARVTLKQAGKYWYKFIADGNWMVDNDNLIRDDDGYGNTNSVYFLPNTSFRLDTFVKAKNVFLAGSFNNWREKELPMIKTSRGWILPVYLAEGTHTYKFIVDGVWYHDPKNPHRLPDGAGSYNSVLNFGNPYLFKLNGHMDAKRVYLAGSFNGWREDELTMKKTTAGWELSYILRPGNYEYKFFVDGKWMTDPSNPVAVDNGQRSKNSFLIIDPNYTFHLKGYAGAKKVIVSGDFTDWSESAVPMKREGDEWVASVHLSKGKHKYKFIVDGNWITDPANKLYEENEYGTGNSVVWVGK